MGHFWEELSEKGDMVKYTMCEFKKSLNSKTHHILKTQLF